MRILKQDVFKVLRLLLHFQLDYLQNISYEITISGNLTHLSLALKPRMLETYNSRNKYFKTIIFKNIKQILFLVPAAQCW